MKNYYRILQIDSSAEQEIVKAAYHRLMKKYHPDVASGGAEATATDADKVRDINEAYAVLSDEDKRRDYDNAFRNYLRESKQQKTGEPDANVVARAVLFKCSVSSRTYQMHLVRNPDWSGPYIVKAFEAVNEEDVASIDRRGSWRIDNVLDRLGGLGRNLRAIVRTEDAKDEEIRLGDIDWTGIKCPDCGKVVQIRPGSYSSFSICARCHRMKCMGDTIKGVAGYYTRCPWCGKNGLISNVIKTGSKGGLRLTGVTDKGADRSVPRLAETKLLDGKPPDPKPSSK
jgi:hypothetical protein